MFFLIIYKKYNNLVIAYLDSILIWIYKGIDCVEISILIKTTKYFPVSCVPVMFNLLMRHKITLNIDYLKLFSVSLQSG